LLNNTEPGKKSDVHKRILLTGFLVLEFNGRKATAVNFLDLSGGRCRVVPLLLFQMLIRFCCDD